MAYARATVIRFTACSNTDEVHRNFMEERLPAMRQQPSFYQLPLHEDQQY
jgi:hypothetical protein